MVSLVEKVSMDLPDLLDHRGYVDHRVYLNHRDRLVEGPCTSGGGRAPVHKSKALS